MKKLLLKGLGIACFFGLSLNVSAQNLCVNGDFEDVTGGTASAPFPNWTYDYGNDFVADASSAAITSRTIRINNKTTTRYLTSQKIDITAGHTYKLTFTARVQAAAGDNGTQLASGTLRSLIFDGVNNVSMTSAWTAIDVTSNTNSTVTGNYTAPLSGDGSTSVRLRFTKLQPAIAYLDDVSFEDLGVLPITLTSFKGTSANTGITLNWATANENNNKNFTISSSTNGKDFIQIGTVNGAGNANTITNYSFIDKAPANGINYYKLTQTDFDGKTTSFDPIAVNFDLNTNDELSVYATQTKLQGQVNWRQTEQATATVRDLSGKTISSEKVSLHNGLNSFVLNGAGLVSSTIYVLTLSSPTNTTSTKFYIN